MAARGRASRSPQRKPDQPVPAAAADEPQNEDQAPAEEPDSEVAPATEGQEEDQAQVDTDDHDADAEQSSDPSADDADPELEEPEDVPVDAAADEQTTDYTRCGGHVLTDHGWIPEDQLEQLGATRTKIETE